ncbi:MAG: tyrosine-type recombinase/integrase [Bacteroidales bacterium]
MTGIKLKNVKKMYHKSTSTSIIQQAISYTLPELYTGKEWYIGFYAYDPITGKLKRKKIKINFIKSITQRRKRAKDIIYNLTCKLEKGWNPWIEVISGSEMISWDDACDKFKKSQLKMLNDGLIEIDSYKTFYSHLNVIIKYNLRKKVPITYVYQFNKEFINDFLDFMYMEKNVTPRTRDNHLAFCRKLITFFCEKGYMSTRPDDGIKSFGKKARKKKRTVIEADDMVRLVEFLEQENKYFLLASYLVYYCCIRPKELSYLQIKHINLKEQTIFIHEDFAKNDKNAVVTLPEKIINLMIDLKLFDSPGSYYIFSSKFEPGEKHCDCRQFREYWTKMVKSALSFPDQYVFYSLKDTGITNMLKSNIDPLTVRDQARHHSIEMTNVYTPQSCLKAQDSLKKFKSF